MALEDEEVDLPYARADSKVASLICTTIADGNPQPFRPTSSVSVTRVMRRQPPAWAQRGPTCYAVQSAPSRHAPCASPTRDVIKAHWRHRAHALARAALRVPSRKGHC